MTRGILAVVLAGVLLGGCTAVTGKASERIAVPVRMQSAVQELVRAVDPGARPSFEGLRCFTAPIDNYGQDGDRWAMSVSIPERSADRLERVRSAAVDLGWQPMRPLADSADLVVADHHRFAEPLEVAVRVTPAGIDMWMYETSDQYSCATDDEEGGPPTVEVDGVWPTEEQETAVHTVAAVVDEARHSVSIAFGHPDSAPEPDSYGGCSAGDRSGANWDGLPGGHTRIRLHSSGKEALKATEGELAAALGEGWRLTGRDERVEDDEAVVELRFASDVGIGATFAAQVRWDRSYPANFLDVAAVRSVCVPPAGV